MHSLQQNDRLRRQALNAGSTMWYYLSNARICFSNMLSPYDYAVRLTENIASTTHATRLLKNFRHDAGAQEPTVCTSASLFQLSVTGSRRRAHRARGRRTVQAAHIAMPGTLQQKICLRLQISSSCGHRVLKDLSFQ